MPVVEWWSGSTRRLRRVADGKHLGPELRLSSSAGWATSESAPAMQPLLGCLLSRLVAASVRGANVYSAPGTYTAGASGSALWAAEFGVRRAHAGLLPNKRMQLAAASGRRSVELCPFQ